MALIVGLRLINLRNIMNFNNISTVEGALNVKRHSNVTLKFYTTTISNFENIFSDDLEKKPEKKLSKTMKIYLQRSKEYMNFLEKETVAYNVGIRHLANIMGEDPDHFNEKDIQKAIRYLLPSGLYDRRAHPMMLHPNKLFGHKKEAEFDESGRPHKYLFYTTKPNYFGILHEIGSTIKYLNEQEDTKIAQNKLPSIEDKFNSEGSEWLSKIELESKVVETISNEEYEYFIKSFNRVIMHPMSKHKFDFIMEYRKQLKSVITVIKLPDFEYDIDKRPFIITKLYKLKDLLIPCFACVRKEARGEVKVTGKGSGNIIINGKDITSFNIQCREQCYKVFVGSDLSHYFWRSLNNLSSL
ncbi:mitochondrial ribosomal protein S9 [Ptiloglossa arizonensis]|uniref:mitochondrial ribosomal protein S9 n=1 Tax=Ptiloglossa arizonensis TaxID=3350558 RepID=UPI003F9F694C